MNTDCNNKDRLPSNGIPFTDENLTKKAYRYMNTTA